jgi:molybdenum cofactor guanylyltransferase
MGRPTHLLPFGPERMLQRVVRLVGEAVGPVIVVAAIDQELPDLPAGVRTVRDRRPDRGPLEGIAVGLAGLGHEAEVAFVTACDSPLVRPAFVRRMVELAEGCDVAVPHVGGFDHPLSAVYRATVLPHVESLLAVDQVRPVFLFDRVRTRRVTADELRDVDPDLDSLNNLNTPTDYAATLRRVRVEIDP